MTAASVPPRRPDPEDPFAAGVRDGIRSAGLTLRQLAVRLAPFGELRSSSATLCDWSNGLCHPTPGELGRNRVLALERCLGLPAGDLVLLLPSTPTTYPSRSQTGLRPVDPLTVRRNALLREVSRQLRPQRAIPVAHVKEYALGWRTVPVMTTVTSTVRALHDGVDRHLFVHAPDLRLHPQLSAIRGCKVGDEHEEALPPMPAATRASNRIAVIELLFDRILRRGETHEFSYAIGYSPDWGAPTVCEPLFRHVQAEPCERLEMRLTTHADWRPAGVVECRWAKPRDLSHEVRTPVDRDARNAYVQRLVDPVPAGYGWRWLPPTPAELNRGRRQPVGSSAA